MYLPIRWAISMALRSMMLIWSTDVLVRRDPCISPIPHMSRSRTTGSISTRSRTQGFQATGSCRTEIWSLWIQLPQTVWEAVISRQTMRTSSCSVQVTTMERSRCSIWIPARGQWMPSRTKCFTRGSEVSPREATVRISAVSRWRGITSTCARQISVSTM